MSEIKSFPTNVVLTIVTGRLMCDIGQVYDILNWMGDDKLFTHQLPRASREAQPVIVALHPALKEALDEAGHVTMENWMEWRDRWSARYGAEIDVPKMSSDQHRRIDPLGELSDMAGEGRIVAAVVVGETKH